MTLEDAGNDTHTRMHSVSEETRRIVDQVLDYSRRRMLADDTPLDHAATEADLKRIAGTTINEDGIGASRTLAVFEHVLAPACITTDHPQFLSFIPSAPSKAAVAFDLVVSASALYGGSWMEGAGVVHAENEVLSWLAAEFGLPLGAGGVFVQGGTIGNLSALVAAREQARVKLEGRDGPGGRWVIVCSAEAHSSIASAAKVMDVDLALVPVAEDGVLRADGVRTALEEYGDRVIAVVATTGSTNFGIVDDVAGIAALKQDHDLWLHIDGAYGLTAMLSPLTRHLYAGVEQADSVIVDPHKWMFAPYDACALIYRDPETGRRAHTQHAEYLDTLTEADDWSPSDYAVQLTRRPRGLPLWFSLATYGAGVYREAITHSINLARQIADEIAKRPGLTLVRDPQLSVVVFERDGWERADYTRWSDQLLADQQAFVVPSSYKGRTNARFAIISPLTTFEQLTAILDTMA